MFLGKLELETPEVSGDFAVLMEWADKYRALKVRTNADTPHDAQVARQFGAEGIGLCRTEHMFFGEGRIAPVREMILAKDTESRKRALAKLLPMQRDDFYQIFKVMEGYPVTIRLLDPPLHEFLPKEAEAIEQAAADLGVTVEELKRRITELQEFNPMLGHRGVRSASPILKSTKCRCRRSLRRPPSWPRGGQGHPRGDDPLDRNGPRA